MYWKNGRVMVQLMILMASCSYCISYGEGCKFFMDLLQYPCADDMTWEGEGGRGTGMGPSLNHDE